jgi:two-component system KDP operon response regulator KdpE
MNAPCAKEDVVLVIENEAQTRRLLRVSLEREGYRVVEAVTGKQGVEEAIISRPEAILLAMELPDMEGMAVLQRLREWIPVPILAMTNRPNEQGNILTLDSGANDIIAKPFSPGEFLARVRAARRHHIQASERDAVFRCGSLTVDLSRREVKVKKRRVPLTVTEYSLLHLFVKHAGKVLTHTQILREIWGPEGCNKVNCLRVYLAYLREKLETNPAKPQFLVTEPGVGYRLAFPE